MRTHVIRTLAVAVLIAAVVALLVVVATRRPSPPAYQPRAVPRTTAPTAGAEAPPRGSSTWRAVAQAYGRSLTDTRGGLSRWLDRLSPLLTPDLLASYRDTDLRWLPDGRFTYLERQSGGEGEGAPTSFDVVLHYDGGSDVEVRLHRSSQGWLVSTAGQVLRPPDTRR
jgi:hypothetical protein